MTKFTPKGEDILKEEETKYINENFSHLEEDDRSKLIKDRTASRFKDENFKASEKKKTVKAREGIEFAKGRKDHYKKLASSKGNKKQERQGLSEDEIIDKAMLKMKGYNRKDDFRFMEQVRKIYKEEGKDISLNDARKTKLFISMREDKELKSKEKKAQLGRSGLATGGNKTIAPSTQQEKDFVEAMKD